MKQQREKLRKENEQAVGTKNSLEVEVKGRQTSATPAFFGPEIQPGGCRQMAEK
ncbi:MAG TPA: hypothetical protein VFD58_09090 [Blastocatellia bacterium]|nr:hypothetical protein [Blastocatellia bacterium]